MKKGRGIYEENNFKISERVIRWPGQWIGCGKRQRMASKLPLSTQAWMTEQTEASRTEIN